jgi:hypothetical protein
LLGDKGLMKDLKVWLMERMLGAELTEHPGDDSNKTSASQQPNQRNGNTRKVPKMGYTNTQNLKVPKHLLPSSDAKGGKWSWRKAITFMVIISTIFWVTLLYFVYSFWG